MRAGRVFAADGNRYFARPAPSLAAGAAVLARCALEAAAEWGAHPSDAAAGLPPAAAGAEAAARAAAVEALGLLPPRGVGWDRVQLPSAPAPPPPPPHIAAAAGATITGASAAAAVGDIEDVDVARLCWRLHEEACAARRRSYPDPTTGYQAGTYAAHPLASTLWGVAEGHSAQQRASETVIGRKSTSIFAHLMPPCPFVHPSTAR